MNKEFVCIHCPLGCRLLVELSGSEVTRVSGNACPRGEEYAMQEAVEPLRVVTSLMRAQDTAHPISVKTSAPIPKRLIRECVKQIFSTEAASKVRRGDVVISNILNTGADVVATQDARCDSVPRR